MMFLFPLLKFWTYSPIGFLCAIVWNVCEVLGIKTGLAPWLFGRIIGAKFRRKEK